MQLQKYQKPGPLRRAGQWMRGLFAPSLPGQPSRRRQYRANANLDRWSAYTGHGLSVAKLISSYREADDGYPEAQCSIFEDRIEVDAHLAAVLASRREGVAWKQWTIQEGGDTDADKAVATQLEDALRMVPHFRGVLEHQLLAIPYGYAGTEIVWGRRNGLTVPVGFERVPVRRFVFDENDDPRLRYDAGDIDGHRLRPGSWWWGQRSGRLASRAGLMRTAALWSHFKSIGVRDWLVFADRFGIPYVTAHYDDPNITEEEKNIAELACQNLGTDGYAIMSEGIKLAIHQATTGGSASDVHGALVSLCDAQISKLVDGATLNTESKGNGSYAIGRVHQTRSHDHKKNDAEWLSESFEACVSIPFIHFNGITGARPPQLKMHLGLDLTVTEHVDIAAKCVNELGMPVDEDQIRQMTGLRKPTGAALTGRSVSEAPQEKGPSDGKE